MATTWSDQLQSNLTTVRFRCHSTSSSLKRVLHSYRADRDGVAQHVARAPGLGSITRSQHMGLALTPGRTLSSWGRAAACTRPARSASVATAPASSATSLWSCWPVPSCFLARAATGRAALPRQGRTAGTCRLSTPPGLHTAETERHVSKHANS